MRETSYLYRRGRVTSQTPAVLVGVPQVSDELLDAITDENATLTREQRKRLKAEIFEATQELKRRHEMGKLGIGPYGSWAAQRDQVLAVDRSEQFMPAAARRKRPIGSRR